MSDGYQRVKRLPPGTYGYTDDRFLRDDEDGHMKVVPADAIVIERADLPEVRPDGSVVVEGHGPSGDYTYWLAGDEDPMKAARAYLSIAASQAARVDEAQVRALASDLALAMGVPNDSDAMARVLVAQGWTRQEPTP